MLKGDRPLVPGQRVYSSHIDARDITFQQANFTLRCIVQQRLQEKQQEELERKKKESKRRRQVEIPHVIIDRPRRLIPVEPILSPFEIERRKVPGEDPLVLQLPLKNQNQTLKP